MKKILLIEDRYERQKLFIGQTSINLLKYEDILYNAVEEKYEETFSDIKENTFDFTKYDIVISHKSAFGNDNESILQKIKNNSKSSKTSLVLFSGGIDTNYYDESDGYKLIELSSKKLYGNNLEDFLIDYRENKYNVLMLSYGSKWRYNMLLNSLERINYFLEIMKEDEASFKRLLLNTNIDTLDIDIDLPQGNPRKIHKDDIVRIRDFMFTSIEESIMYE